MCFRKFCAMWLPVVTCPVLLVPLIRVVLAVDLHKVDNAYCSPTEACRAGVLEGMNGDGCSITWLGNCTGTCSHCAGSTAVGRVCRTMEGATCGIPTNYGVPVQTLDCGPRTDHPCINGGQHGSSGCCPPSTYMPRPNGNCDAVPQCTT